VLCFENTFEFSSLLGDDSRVSGKAPLPWSSFFRLQETCSCSWLHAFPCDRVDVLARDVADNRLLSSILAPHKADTASPVVQSNLG